MPEYIERETAIKMIEEDLPEVVYYKKEDAISCLECMPAASVVPKSEFEKLQKEKDALIKNYAECMKDYAKEIFKEIEKPLNEWIELYYKISVSTFDSIEQAKAIASESVLRAFCDYTAGLRKKYVEEANELT